MVCYAAIPNWYRDQGVSWESKCILKLRALTCCKWWVTLYYCRVIFHCRYTTSTLAIHLLVDTISFDELTRADSNMTLRGDVSRHCFLWRDEHSNMLKFIFKVTIFREVPFCHFHTQSKQALFLASISALNLQRKKNQPLSWTFERNSFYGVSWVEPQENILFTPQRMLT